VLRAHPATTSAPDPSRLNRDPMLVRPSLFISVAVLLPLPFVSTLAAAQQPAATVPDAGIGKGYMVLTKYGKVVTGTLLEKTETKVVLRLRTGETEQLDPIEIDKAGPLESGNPGDLPQGLAPLPPPPSRPNMSAIDAVRPPKAEDNAYKGPHPVTVHLQLPDSTTAVTLYQKTGKVAGEDQFKPLCTADCSVPVDPHGTYMVGGFMVKDSRDFQLPEGASNVTARSTPRFTTDTIVGWTLLGIGTVLALANTYTYTRVSDHNPVWLIPSAVGGVLAVFGVWELARTTSVDVTAP
jgi:hypothetical protein